MIKSLKLPFWFGLGGNIGDGKQPLPWIHIDDLCNLIKFALENQHVKGTLNGVAPQIITYGDFTKVCKQQQQQQIDAYYNFFQFQAFSSALRRPAFFTTPPAVMKQIFGPERAALLLTGAKIQPKRVTELNFNYKYPNIVDACREVC